LNVFEKNIPCALQDKATSLILDIIKENIPEAKEVSYGDSYAKVQEEVTVEYDLEFINNLIGYTYTDEEAKAILARLGFVLEGNTIKVPFWRTDINFKADIAEEIARVHGFDNVEATISSINTGATSQPAIYRLKKETSHFFVDRGFYEMYNYSFIGKALAEKVNDNIENYLPLRNFLSEDATHMRASLVTSLLNSLEENIRDEKNLKMFELEKVYPYNNKELKEGYRLASVVTEE
jgi:phenylalanyl-tRNA synthetase beta chain